MSEQRTGPVMHGTGAPRGEIVRSKKIIAAEKRRTVMAQYAAGATAARIAEVNGWTERSVHAILTKAISTFREDTTASVESVRATQIMRLDNLLLAVWPRATANPPDLAAVREVLRIEALRAKIAGTERAPEGQGGGDLHLHLVDPDRVRELQESFRASAGELVEGTAVEVLDDAG